MLLFMLLSCYGTATASFAQEPIRDQLIEKKSISIIKTMTLREKIGQKLMLDIPRWCATGTDNSNPCLNHFTVGNPDVMKLLSENYIGGMVLFAANFVDVEQITTLIDDLQQNMKTSSKLPLFMAVDQEGGIINRLPAKYTVNFPGNMATAAAYLGKPGTPYAAAIGKTLGSNLKSLGINIDFAPDVDVNANPLNPVIHVRSFSDDAQLVALLGEKMSKAMGSQGVAATLKHFPGHGDTEVDSHIGLPVVHHSFEEAFKVDLFPFKKIIKHQQPDLIMTAHIQYPALDDSTIVASKTGESIVTPATFSRKIQFDLLRKQFAYQGIVISDALDMGAVADNFETHDAVIKAFQAGVDIALMPITVSEPNEAYKISELVMALERAVLTGEISEVELDKSVQRIIKLKLKLGLFNPDHRSLPQKIADAKWHLASKKQQTLEQNVSNDAVTLVQNTHHTLPLKLGKETRIHILTPWYEQGAGMVEEIKRLQNTHQLPQTLHVSFAKIVGTDLEAIKQVIDSVDVVIVGHSTSQLRPLTYYEQSVSNNRLLSPKQSLVFPAMAIGDSNEFYSVSRLEETDKINYAQFIYQVLQYAQYKGKKTIFISLLAPYDLPNYRYVSDAMLAGYNFYGYYSTPKGSYYRGPSMPALTRVIFGIVPARGKLPINIPNPENPDEIVYFRGYGLYTQ